MAKFAVGQKVKFLPSAREVHIPECLIGKTGIVKMIGKDGSYWVELSGIWTAFERHLAASTAGYDWAYEKI